MEDFRFIVTDKTDRAYFMDAINMILKAGSRFLKTYNMAPDKIIFSGAYAKPIYDYIIEKKLNLNAIFEFKKSSIHNEIIIQNKHKIKVKTNIGGHSRGESLNGVMVEGIVLPPPDFLGGLEIIKETDEIPVVIISLIKL